MDIYKHKDLTEQLDKVFSIYAEKTAVIDYKTETDTRELTYSRLRDITENVKDLLTEQGICPPERIAVLTRPSAYSAILLLSLAYLGYTAVLPDVSLPLEEQHRLLEFTEPSAVITVDEQYPKIPDSTKRDIPVYRLFSDTEPMKLLNPEITERRISDIPGDDDVTAIIFTSGTTGSLKGAEVTYQAMMYSAKASTMYAEYGDKSRFLHILPQTHIAGYAMLFINFLQGAQMAFVPEISAAGLSMGLRTYEPTHLVMIPKVYETIQKKIETEIAKRSKAVQLFFKGCMKLSSFIRRHTGHRMTGLMRPFYSKAFGRNINVIGCGTAPCAPETVKFFSDLAVNFLNVYGSTEESFPICCGNVTTERYPDNSAGNAKQFPFIDIKIVDGEIAVKSALQMKGYFRDTESTKNSLTPDGYFKTGDLGYLNEKGYLHITGRRKETIQLSSGNKVSAADIDRYYGAVSGDIPVAACGIPDTGGLNDLAVLFIETGSISAEQAEKVRTEIRRLSDSTNGSYRLSEILCIEKLPCTTLGKVQRFKLRETAMKMLGTDNTEQTAPEKMNKPKPKQQSGNVLEEICDIINKYTTAEVRPDSRLSEDLNLDSIAMFEICTELETHYHAELLDRLNNIHTVKELAALAKGDTDTGTSEEHGYDIEQFPLSRRKKDCRRMNIMMSLARHFYKFEVYGDEQIKSDSQYIFCPNHESHLDGLWMWTALKDRMDSSHIACLAKQEHLEHGLNRAFLRMVGGIPTDRSGNPAPAIRRAVEVIQNEHAEFLIHPEGTRTRSGEMGSFKGGAAMISIETGVPLVPVCIVGARKIYPPNKKLPKLFNFSKHCRLTLKIKFGKPIFPKAGDSAESLTVRLRDAVVKLREEREKSA